MTTELVVAAADALKTTETVVPLVTEATTAAANIEQGAAAASNQTLRDLAEGPAQGEMDAMAKRDGLLTEDEYTDPKRINTNDINSTPGSSAGNTEAPPEPSQDDVDAMAARDGLLKKDEFDKTEVGQKELATKTANECLTSATDSVRADILRGMKKEGQEVQLNDKGWPEDPVQAAEMHDAMLKREGEIEDKALKAIVVKGLGPAPDPVKDPQGYRKWSEDYKKGVDAALKGKKEYIDKNSAKTADAAGTAGAAPATGETAPSAAANSKEVAATTPEATAEKKDSAEKQNTLGQAFKDATDYLLAPNENTLKKAETKSPTNAGSSATATETAGTQPKEKPGSITKEKIMEAVDKFNKTKEGEGYKKKFIFALVSLTAILGIALEGVSNLDEKAKQEMHRSEQIGSSHS